MGNPRENALGDLQGQIQQIIDNSSAQAGKYDPIHNIWTYFTQPMSQQQASQNLFGAQSRTMGDVGRNAGAQAAAYGVSNPYAWIQHAQAQVADRYANQAADLPFKVANQNLMANQGNLENLYKLLALKGNAAAGRDVGVGPTMTNSFGNILQSWLSRPYSASGGS